MAISVDSPEQDHICFEFSLPKGIKLIRIILQATQIRALYFTSIPCFAKLYSVFNGISITNCLPFFFQTDGYFYQMILSHTLGRGPNDSLINTHYHNSKLILRTVSRRVDEVIPSDHPRRVASRVVQWYSLIHET